MQYDKGIMSEYEIEDILNKVEFGLAEAQHDMLVEETLHNSPVVVSDGKGHVVEMLAKELLAKLYDF